MSGRARLLLSLLLMGSWSAAQQAPSGADAKTVRHLLFPVSVVDGSGRAVPGLKKEDFSVKRGRTELRTVEAQEVPGRGTSAPGIPFFFVLDKTTIVVPQLGNAKSSLLKYLAASVKSGELVGLFNLTAKGIVVTHQPGTPLPVLAAALEQLDGETKALGGKFRSELGLDESAKAAVAPELARLREFGAAEEPFSRSIDAAFAQLRGLQQLANGMRRIPGHKDVLFITRGLPLTLMESEGRVFFQSAGSAQNLGPQMRTGGSTAPVPDATDAQRYGDRRYAQENRALTVEFEKAMEMLNEARVTVYPLLMDQTGPQSDPMLETFAAATAGKYVTFQADVEPAARQAANEPGAYYLLSCEVPPAKGDDLQWAKLDIEVNRPGVKLRHPRGYFVMPAAGR